MDTNKVYLIRFENVPPGYTPVEWFIRLYAGYRWQIFLSKTDVFPVTWNRIKTLDDIKGLVYLESVNFEQSRPDYDEIGIFFQ